MSFYLIRFTLFSLLAAGLLSGCGERQQADSVVRYSQPQVCEFAADIAALDAKQPDAKQLRFINETWRGLSKDNAFRPDELTHAQQLITELNYFLARDSLQLIERVLEITAATYEEIEGLRRFSSNPREMKVPDSILRNYRNAVQACCADALSANATALVREDEASGLYAVGRRAYFIQRDVTALLNNDLTFTAYREKLASAAASIPAQTPVVDIAPDWVTCRR